MPEIIKCNSSDSVESTASVEIIPKPMPVVASISFSDKTDDEADDGNSSSSEVFQVELITGIKYVKNKRYFKVRWQGYGPDADTWEPETHLRENPNLVQLIDDYIEEHGDVKRRVKVENKPRYEEESVSEDEEWFGIKPDECNREKRNLYVADRIQSFTEKILSEIDPGVRVLRNHLRSSLGDSAAQNERSRSRVKSETPSSIASSLQSNTGRRGRPAKKRDEEMNRDVSIYDDGMPPVLEREDELNIKRMKDSDITVIGTACDQDGTKVVRKRFISRPKSSNDPLNDVFTCDDVGGSGRSGENSTESPNGSDQSTADKKKRRRVDANVEPMKVKREVADEPSSSASLKKTVIERKPTAKADKKMNPSHKHRATDHKMDETQKKIKQSSAAGVKNLACRRSALASERVRKAPPSIPSDVPNDQISFVEQLVAGKLLPEQKKPEATKPVEKTAAAGKALYTPATSSSLYKPRPYKISRKTDCLSTSVPTRPMCGGDVKPMQKVSKMLSSGTIIDSLIPVSNLTSGSSSSLSSVHIVTQTMAGSGGTSSPLPSPAAFDQTSSGQPMTIDQRQRTFPPPQQLAVTPTSSTTLSMTCEPLTKSFELLIAERLASVRLLTMKLSQPDFEESALDGNLERVRAALAVDDNTIDLNAVSLEGGTLLHRVCERKCDSSHTHCDIIELLVRSGARMDMREPCDRGSPLHTAVAAGRLCHVRKLLALRSPVNLTDNSDRTPLILAMERGRDDEYVGALLKAGATFHTAFRHKNLDRHIIHSHQKQLQAAFDRAIATIFSNVKCKPISSIFVNTLYDGRQLEHSFSVRDLVPPGANQAYAVLTCPVTMIGDKIEGRMCGYTPVQNVYVNNRQCVPLTKYVQLAALRNGSNTLTLELDGGLVIALANAGRLSICRRGGTADRPSDFVCAGLRLLTQVYYLHFNRHYSSSGGNGGHSTSGRPSANPPMAPKL